MPDIHLLAAPSGSRDTGKLGVRSHALTSLQAHLSKTQPELVAPIFTAPTGADALNSPETATVTALATLFVEAPAYLVAGPPAHLALYRRRLLLDPGMSLAAWGERAQVTQAAVGGGQTCVVDCPWQGHYADMRWASYSLPLQACIGEILGQQAAVAALELPLGPADSGSSISLAQLVGAFIAAGASTTYLPPATALAPPLNISYNLAAWDGSTAAYMRCSLPLRTPQYVGMCEAQTVACAPLNDTTPYACSLVATGVPVSGNLSFSEYREACELPCDRRLDCAAICDCTAACGANEVCVGGKAQGELHSNTAAVLTHAWKQRAWGTPSSWLCPGAYPSVAY